MENGNLPVWSPLKRKLVVIYRKKICLSAKPEEGTSKTFVSAKIPKELKEAISAKKSSFDRKSHLLKKYSSLFAQFVLNLA